MKKILSSALCVLMLLGCIVLPVGAVDEYAAVDEALIADYDFASNLNNSASESTTDAFVASDASKVTVESGMLKIRDGKHAKITLSDANAAGLKTSLGAATEATFFINVRIHGDGQGKGGNRNLFTVSGSKNLKLYTTSSTTCMKKLYFSDPASSTVATSSVVGTSFNGNGDTAPWYKMIITMKFANNDWTYKFYVAEGDGSFEERASFVKNDATKYFSGFTSIELGSHSNTNAENLIGYDFDDFRIYNKALTEAEIQYATGKAISKGAPPQTMYPTLDDALIANYTFEDANNAASTTTTDAFSGIDGTDVTVNDGMLSVRNKAYATLDLTSEASSGLKESLTSANEATFFMNVRIQSDKIDKGGNRNIFSAKIDFQDASSTMKVYTTSGSTGTHKVYFADPPSSTLATSTVLGTQFNGDGDSAKWYQVAVTMKSSNSDWIYKVFVAENGGMFEEKASFVKNITKNGAYLDNISYLYLGSQGSTNEQNTIGYDFDDFRIYNKALSAEQLKYAVGQSAAGAVFHGVQEVTTGEDFDVRFIGSIDSLEYAEVGFVITAQDGAYKWEKSASKVYTTVLANNGLKEYTAAELRKGSSGYIYALSITDVPIKAEGGEIALDVTFIVTPYYVKESGGARVSGNSYTVCYSGGAFKSISVNPAA